MITVRLKNVCCFLVLAVSSLYCQIGSVTILHTNDMHAAFVPHEVAWIRNGPRPEVGGFLELGWIIDSLRKEKRDLMVFDGGDVMTGNPIAEYKYKNAFGGALFEMMNLIGYDAWSIGNHDLDISQDNLKRLTEIADFPTLSANLVDSSDNFILNNQEYIIIERNGVRIGVIGLMSDDLFRLTNTDNLIGLKVLPAGEILQKIIDKIDTNTDIIIALTHQGVDSDSIMAEKVRGLDVIIGSHSHTRLKTPKVVNKVIICQTGAYCENLGELDLIVQNDEVVSFNSQLHTLFVSHSYPDNDLKKLVGTIKEIIDDEYGEILCTLGEDYRRSRSGESKIGRFISDAIREGTNADFAVMNSSGIRKDLIAGNVTKLDLFEIAPFRNYLCTFQIYGKDIRRLLQDHIRSIAEGRTSLDFSGIQCRWKRDQDTVIISSVTLNGRELSDDILYLCGTIDYVVNQGDRYLGMRLENVEQSRMLLFDAIVGKVRRDKTIENKNGSCFREIN